MNKIFKMSKWHPFGRLRGHRFTVSADGVRHDWGILAKNSKTVPRERITNVDVKIAFMFGSSAVKVNTGAGEKVAFIGLTRETARELADAIQQLQLAGASGEESPAFPARSPSIPPPPPPPPPGAPSQS